VFAVLSNIALTTAVPLRTAMVDQYCSQQHFDSSSMLLLYTAVSERMRFKCIHKYHIPVQAVFVEFPSTELLRDPARSGVAGTPPAFEVRRTELAKDVEVAALPLLLCEPL
jgi:hypothetical protein